MVRGAFHHALIIPATFLNERPKADGTGVKIRREALYDSEDLARHMANYVMNQIPTLSVAHISSGDIIASDIWSDPFRVYACLFAKASRVLFLVTHHDVAAFGKFTRGHLQPLLNQSTPKDYDWKSRFLVLAMGDFELPASLPCEVIRFREVGWFRDSMALFVLGKKIQEFWTPKQESFCLVASTEKLKFATNLEETEIFQTSLIVKNLNDEDPTEKRGDIQENFNTKFDHGGTMASNDGPSLIARQNFNVQFDIISNRLLEIHELLLPNISVPGLSGTNQPLQTSAHYYTAQSDVGLIGSSSDMDDISPALGEVHSTSDSVGEMQWSPPDSVSIVRETEVDSALSPNESGLTLVTTEANGLRSKSLQSNDTEKASVAAGIVEITLESEPPKPTKRTRTAGDQVVNRSPDLSPVGKQRTFFIHERDTPIALSVKDIHSPITANTSTKGPLEAIVESSVESNTDSCPQKIYDFSIQSIFNVQKSGGSPCSEELETMPTIFRRISPSDHFKVANDNAIASSNLGGDQKCTSLMESQYFGEEDEQLKDIRTTEIKLKHTSPFTPFPSSLQSNSEVSGDGDKVKGQGEESNSKPRNQISDELTPGYKLVPTSDDLSCQTKLVNSDEESLCSTKGESLSSGELEEVSHDRNIENRRSRTSNTHDEGNRALQSSQSSTYGFEVKRKACELNVKTGTSSLKSQLALKNTHNECQSSPVRKDPIPQFTDSRTDEITTITDTADGYFSDTCIQRIKSRLTDIPDGNFKAYQGKKRRNSSFENTNLLSQRRMEKCLPKKQSANELPLNLAINKTRNESSDPYSVFSTIRDAQVDVGSTSVDKKSLQSSIEPTIAGNRKTLSSATVDTSESPAIGNVASGNDLLESTVVPKIKKTALTESDSPSVSEKRVPPYVELNLPGNKIKYFDMEGSSQVDMGADLNASNVPNMRQTSPSIPLSVSNKPREHATSYTMDIQDAADDNGKGYRDDYPTKDLVKTIPASLVHSNVPVHKTHEHFKAAIPVYSPASKGQSMLAIREPSLLQTTDVVKHRSWKSDKTQNIDAPKKVILGEQSEFQTQESGETVQVIMNTMESRSEDLRMSTQKGKKSKLIYDKSSLNKDSAERENPKASNEYSRRQYSPTKRAIAPTNNCISSEETSYGVKWTSQDLSMSPPKCDSPFPDSDCDPEITSSTMSRPSCLLSAEKFPSPTVRLKNLSRAKTAQADYLKSSILRDDLKRDQQNEVLLPHHYATPGAKTMKSEVMKRCQRLGEHKSEIDKRLSSISITDEANQREFEVADTAVGSNYSELGVLRRPGVSSVRLLHETGEYQRNLSTQVQSGGKSHEIEAHGPYFRLIREESENDEGPSTYWCDRSVGSPTPYGLSIRSDTTSNSSIASYESRIPSKDAEFAADSREKTVSALFSVCRALGKASKLLSSSNEIIMKQIEQLNSEQQ